MAYLLTEEQIATLRAPNLRENLENELMRAEANVRRLQEALTLLDNNKDIARILELLGNRY